MNRGAWHFFVIGGPSPLKGLKTERRFKLAEKLVLIDHISWFFHSRAFYQIPLIFWWHYMEKASIYVDYVCPREKSSLPIGKILLNGRGDGVYGRRNYEIMQFCVKNGCLSPSTSFAFKIHCISRRGKTHYITELTFHNNGKKSIESYKTTTLSILHLAKHNISSSISS